MKKIFLIAVVAALTACNSSTEKKEAAMDTMSSDSTKKEDVPYAYPVQYMNIEVGDAKFSQTVLNIWKAWDNHDLTSVKNSFADSVEFALADGSIIKGSLDSVFSTLQSLRNNFSSIKSSVNAVFSFSGLNKNTNQKDNFVAVWGKEVNTTKNGKSDSIMLHEVWLFNKSGKISAADQFSQAFAKGIVLKSNK